MVSIVSLCSGSVTLSDMYMTNLKISDSNKYVQYLKLGRLNRNVLIFVNRAF